LVASKAGERGAAAKGRTGEQSKQDVIKQQQRMLTSHKSSSNRSLDGERAVEERDRTVQRGEASQRSRQEMKGDRPQWVFDTTVEHRDEGEDVLEEEKEEEIEERRRTGAGQERSRLPKEKKRTTLREEKVDEES